MDAALEKLVMSTEGARRFIPLNLSGKRTEKKQMQTFVCLRIFVLYFFGAAELSDAPIIFCKGVNKPC